jgi:hypothetical protein
MTRVSTCGMSCDEIRPEQVSTSGIGEERGAVAFLLFLLPKPSVKPNSVRQTDPRSYHHVMWFKPPDTAVWAQ